MDTELTTADYVDIAIVMQGFANKTSPEMREYYQTLCDKVNSIIKERNEAEFGYHLG